MAADRERLLSLALFQELKPHCVHLSQFREQEPRPSTTELEKALRHIVSILHDHKAKNPQDYVLSTKLADYIFFPVSYVFGLETTTVAIDRSVLQILSFLLENAWYHDLDPELLDTLAPVVMISCGVGNPQKNSRLEDAFFRAAVVSCLTTILKCMPLNYFTTASNVQKHLSILGDATTILLSVIPLLDLPSEEDLIVAIYNRLLWVYCRRLTAEQTSMAFPGLVSSAVNIATQARNLHTPTLVAILDYLSSLIVKVFADESMKVTLTETKTTDLNLLSLLLQKPQEATAQQPVKIVIDLQQGAHRTELWLRATSQQLKITITVLMKRLLLDPRGRAKLTQNAPLVDAVIQFVAVTSRSCFQTLFNELMPTNLDILSALLHALDLPTEEEQQQLVNRITDMFLLISRPLLKMFSQQLDSRLTGLVINQLPVILISTSEDKISLCVTAIKLHLAIASAILDALGASPSTLNVVKSHILKTLASGITLNVTSNRMAKTSAVDKRALLDRLSGAALHDFTQESTNPPTNDLNGIELPPYINAKSLVPISKKSKPSLQFNIHTSTAFKDEFDASQLVNRTFFGASFTSLSENRIKTLVEYIGLSTSKEDKEQLISTAFELAESDSSSPLHHATNLSVVLWLTGILLAQGSPQLQASDFDISEFIDIEQDDALEVFDDSAYIMLQNAELVVGNIRNTLDNQELSADEVRVYEIAYSLAMHSLGVLATKMTKEDFQTDVLMDYLYPLLEALTQPVSSEVHQTSRGALQKIIDVHYNGSMELLIKENADFIVDSLSLQLSVSSGLVPSLAGILLVILRTSGVELLLLNHLQDILSEIFIVIDSYHGYSTLVENFFYVFDEVVKSSFAAYGKNLLQNLLEPSKIGAFKPWGLTNLSEALDLVDEASRSVDPFENYDPQREYFVRKDNLPFDQQADSDDEDEDESADAGPPPEEDPKWPSPIPQNVYMSLQQITTYGFQLLTHPSVKLRRQVLQTMKRAWPLLCTNYKNLMPVVAQHWSQLLVLAVGRQTLSETDETDAMLNSLIAPTLELFVSMVEEDRAREMFLSSRFTSLWEFLKQKSPFFSTSAEEADNNKQALQVAKSLAPEIKGLYATLLVQVVNSYGRLIPDLTAHEMVRACLLLGIPEDLELGRDVRNHMWVLRHHWKQLGE